MSISAEEEVSLRIAVAIELDDVMPRDGLAAVVIDRYRRGVRRRIAGAVGVAVAFAGIGVPLGLTASGGGSHARSGAIVLRLGAYALRLPGMYRLTSPGSAACASALAAARAASSLPAEQDSSHAPGERDGVRLLAAVTTGTPGAQAVAGASPGGCVVMMLVPAAGSGPAGPGPAPAGAEPVTAGGYPAWLVPAPRGATLVVDADQLRDAVIAASGLTPAALISLTAAGLHHLPT